MVEYCKVILKKVSFDHFLFERELRKSIAYILPEEVEEFLSWTKLNFDDQYLEVISRIQDLL